MQSALNVTAAAETVSFARRIALAGREVFALSWNERGLAPSWFAPGPSHRRNRPLGIRRHRDSAGPTWSKWRVGTSHDANVRLPPSRRPTL